MSDNQLRILAAFDDSDMSMEAVRYIASMFPPRDTAVVLFYVHVRVPEGIMYPAETSNFQIKKTDVRAFITNQHKKVHQAFEDACKILHEAGFPPEAVTVKSQDKRVGIARDIIRESQEGYNAVVVGRTGSGMIKDILLGSIPTKLLGKISSIPLIVVGGKSEQNKVLVAFDESKEIVRAVRRMGRLLNQDKCEVHLCHILTSQEEKDRMESLMEELKGILCNQGFKQDIISSELVTEQTSEANCIIEKSKKGGFETIVIGRRELSAIKEFFLGRVGEKIFKQGENITVWIWC